MCMLAKFTYISPFTMNVLLPANIKHNIKKNIILMIIVFFVFHSFFFLFFLFYLSSFFYLFYVYQHIYFICTVLIFQSKHILAFRVHTQTHVRSSSLKFVIQNKCYYSSQCIAKITTFYIKLNEKDDDTTTFKRIVMIYIKKFQRKRMKNVH